MTLVLQREKGIIEGNNLGIEESKGGRGQPGAVPKARIIEH